jgi:hypothetical protein
MAPENLALGRVQDSALRALESAELNSSLARSLLDAQRCIGDLPDALARHLRDGGMAPENLALRHVQDSALRALESAELNPSLARSLLDAQRYISNVPDALARYTGSVSHQYAIDEARNTLHSHFADALNLVENRSKWNETQRLMADLVGIQHATAWDEMTRHKGFLSDQLAHISDFDRLLRGIVPAGTYEAWSAHLTGTALPTLSFLAHDWPTGVGVMTEVDRANFGASVAWLTRQQGEPQLTVAAIIPADGYDAPQIVGDDDPQCAICGNPMLTLGTTLKWIGPRRALRQRVIFPACQECTAIDRHHPGYLQDKLADFARPAIRLRVVRGNGRGNLCPRGALWLAHDRKKRKS